MVDGSRWDQLAAQSGAPGGQAEAQIRSFQLMTNAIEEFNRKSGRQARVMTWLTVWIAVLTMAMLWLGYSQYERSVEGNSASGNSSPPVSSGSVVLDCDYSDSRASFRDVYALDVATKSARLLSVDPPRSGGSLEVGESGYRIVFPESKAGAIQLRVEINRYTGRASRELGRLRTYEVEGKQEQMYPTANLGMCAPAAEKARF